MFCSSQTDVTAAEGHTVTLGCEFETSITSNAYLLWYKQEENDFPRFLTQHYSSEKGQKSAEDFHTEIKNKSVPLTIQKLQVSDSAVYYCALRPTERQHCQRAEEKTTPTVRYIQYLNHT
uniref:Ig-like domain-containing protein n=1 Tax=Seriola dumerili TaxID=41447 RepID=A0A3B4V6Z2_SERDU